MCYDFARSLPHNRLRARLDLLRIASGVALRGEAIEAGMMDNAYRGRTGVSIDNDGDVVLVLRRKA